MNDDEILWLWFCSECGAVWLTDCENDSHPVNFCPSEPEDHDGACFYWIIDGDYATATVEEAWGSWPDYEAMVDGVWLPFDAEWSMLLSGYPVQRCERCLSFVGAVQL